MEAITKETIIDFFSKNEIKLASTHNKLCLPIINRIYKKMVAGIKFTGIKVENNIICDGHHRFVASLLANIELDLFLGIKSNTANTVSWIDVVFDKDDWDTVAKIKMLNEQDALYNNIPIEVIIELIK